ncbi:MAG: ABC transporter ATP-binding protein [Haloferacaceae archaeon]
MTDDTTTRPRADDPLLRVDDLRTTFDTDEGLVRAVDGVSFDLYAGETLCLVGESGSGKTVTAESITRLVECPPGEVTGRVEFRGEDLVAASESRLQEIRGAEIAHVFQNPQDALNPVLTVGWQVAETVLIHEDVSRRAARKRAVDLLDRVEIPDPAAAAESYPHELSGGMKQRVLVAVALASEPDLLIADEPTTALDVTIQAQILDLLADLQRDLGMAVLFITHDLGVVARVADRVVVLYAGKVMERATVADLFDAPGHPYTRALLACLPGRGRENGSIPGSLPNPTDPPAGCRFAARCPFAVEACRGGPHPDLFPVAETAGEEDAPSVTAGDPPAGSTPVSAAPADGSPERDPDASGRPSDDDHLAACIFHGPDRDSAHLDREVAWDAGSIAEPDGGSE